MTNVAIVTSISFGGDNAACFNKGLLSVLAAAPNIPDPFQANGVYDTNTLRTLVRNAANSYPRPDLIVAAGGLVMAQAAAAELTNADPKFVYLTGDTLTGNAPAAAGGVNMNNPGEDQVRKQLLKDNFGLQPGKLYLVVNFNAPMSGNDANNWPPAKVAKFFQNGNPPGDPTNDLNTEFTNLKNSNPTPEGLVISADPYFRLWRTAFTKALGNILAVPVCYPFQDYIDAINAEPNQPNLGNSVALDQPKLNNSTNDSDPNTAYYQLGKQAGRFLSGTANVKVVKWDAATATWLPPS